ncbi:cop9 complex subunit 7A, putative [Ixodes scapularis]|uniref:Cop9 complex subunit 7A, putative n=1 Tax=Ixodes scapularis TaxID=6945 RepID=B7Q4F2_IXOSC|nr:cop9 complex subunit 7A, putative [Ixodes scapularis]|eukprot:XP_002411532.1 cop9 complex subunit 7A, putative [Ixodes scapularis]
MSDNKSPTALMQSSQLEQYLLLAKTAKGAAAAELIKQVTEAPGVYVFGELLDMPNIQECIPYSTLLKELDMKNLRELEDLIIEVIYADVVRGKLDQKNNQLEVDYTIGRDIRTEDIGTVIKVLQEWCTSCEVVLNNIECQISRANAMKDSHIKLKQQIENEVTSIKKNLKVQSQDAEDQVTTDAREDGHMDKPSKKQAKAKGCGGQRHSKETRSRIEEIRQH